MRQARSDVTRRRIVDAATELFDAVGYSAVGLGEIIGRAGITKGAFYYHFDSKATLASAVVEEGVLAVTAIFADSPRASTPALENLIHGAFVVAGRVRDNTASRAAFGLIGSLAGYDEAVGLALESWLTALSARVGDAVTEGDVREDIDTGAVAETLLEMAFGVGLFTRIRPGEPAALARRLVSLWEWVLPAVATPDALPYFQEYLARESMRHHLGPER